MAFEPSFPRVLDNTLMSAFRSCPQKFFLGGIQGWSLPSSIHLHAGQAFAAGLEAARRAFWEKALQPEEAVAEGLQALWIAYGPVDPPDGKKDAISVAEALVYYFDVWPLDEDPAVPARLPSGKRAIEFGFVEPIMEETHPETGEPLLYAGRADMLVELNGAVFIEDDKTTSSLGASWSNQWDLRSQFTGYVWAAGRSGLSRIKPSGVLVRGVSIQATGPKHAQYITYRTPWEIDRWYAQLLRDIRRMKQCWAEGWWDFNLDESCSAYGGCVFRQVCKSPNPQEWLKIHFIRRFWDPVTRKETVYDE